MFHAAQMRKKGMSDGGQSAVDIARRLIALRESMGYSQSGFAKLLDITPSQMNNYEQAVRTISLPIARRVRLKTGATLDWIYDGERAGMPFNLLSKLPDDFDGQKRA